jgi:outer membrane biosynthesis protein TonB
VSGNFWANDDKACCASASVAGFNSEGTQVVTGSTTFASRFNAVAVNYIGTIQLPSDIAPGTYDVKAMAADNLNQDGAWQIVGAFTVLDPNPSPSPSASPSASASPSPSATPTEEPGAPTIPTPTTSTIPTPTTSTIPTPADSTIPTPTTSTIPTPVASIAPKVVATPKATALISPTPKPASKPVKIAAPNKQTNAGETKAAAPKVQTIFCYKGKLLKKVTAPKPVCPKGYVKRK